MPTPMGHAKANWFVLGQTGTARGARRCRMYPVSHRPSCISTRRTLGVPVRVYTVCVCIYIYMLYI